MKCAIFIFFFGNPCLLLWRTALFSFLLSLCFVDGLWAESAPERLARSDRAYAEGYYAEAAELYAGVDRADLGTQEAEALDLRRLEARARALIVARRVYGEDLPALLEDFKAIVEARQEDTDRRAREASVPFPPIVPVGSPEWERLVVPSTEEIVQTLPLQTDASGEASARIEMAKPGQYTLRWQSGNSATLLLPVVILPGASEPWDSLFQPDDRFRIVPEKREVKAGETARFLYLSAPYPASGYVFWQADNGQAISLPITTSQAAGVIEVEVPINAREWAEASIHLWGNHQSARASARVDAEPLGSASLAVVLSTETDIALPGTRATLGIRVTDDDDQPVPAEVAALAFDGALIAYERDLPAEAEAWLKPPRNFSRYFLLEQVQARGPSVWLPPEAPVRNLVSILIGTRG